MTQCPSCSQSITITEDNYGTLYRCVHCNVEFFIGFDGVPENSKQPVASDDVMAEPSSPVPTTVTPATSDLPTMPEPIYDVAASSHLFNIESTNDPLVAGHYDSNSLNSFSEPVNEAAVEPVSEAFQNFTQDVRDFGNDTVSTGILSFDIEISGIDLAELKAELMEALDDKRFGWNIDEISQSIQDGKLILKNISAPRIIVLVKRLAPIGLELNWRHHVSTQ